jgi:hypothetical protein
LSKKVSNRYSTGKKPKAYIIRVLNLTDKQASIIVDGWIEFIQEGDFFLAYWDQTTVWQNDNLF